VKKAFPYDLTLSHNASVTNDDDEQTAGQTDDNSYHKLGPYG